MGGHSFDGHARLSWIGEDATQLRMSDVPEVVVDVALGDTGHGVITKVENAIAGLPRVLTDAHERLERAKGERDSAAEALGAPFARAQELADAQAELEDIDRKMSASQRPPEVQTESSSVDPCVAATPERVSVYIEEIKSSLARTTPQARSQQPPAL